MNASSPPVFDPGPLQRQTAGNASLQTERLALFLTEAERLMLQIEQAPDSGLRAQRLRALGGLARNTGAMRVAHEARLLETAEDFEEGSMGPLREAMAATIAFLHRAG